MVELTDQNKEMERGATEQRNTEAASTDRGEIEKQLEELRETVRREKIHNEFLKLATSYNIKYLDDAFKLADLSGVVLDENGISGVEESIKTLIKDRPYLLKNEEKTEPRSIGRPSNPSRPTEKETLRSQLEHAKRNKDFNKVIELSNKLKTR